jgi:nucleotide-binding universal stress UspA family protein
MNILLAIDFSTASEAAILEVATRPWPPATSVQVVTVVEPSQPWALSELVEEVMRLSRDLTQRTAERLRSCGLDATPVVLSGDPKHVIVEQAERTAADLVVVGSHGDKGLTRFLLGGVARAVVRLAPCSVTVVRTTPGKGARRAGMKVLLATDGSECSGIAARAVAERLWPDGTEVRILSVVELSLPTFQAALEPPFANTEAMEILRANAMKHAQDAIRSAEEIVAAGGLKTSESVSVLLESPKQIILDEAGTWSADLIVVGSHGRRGFNRFLLGSVSEAVATHAGCSVEVIRKRPSAGTSA